MAQTTYHGQYPQQYTYNTPTLESYASQYSAQLQQHQYGDYSQTTRPLSPMEELVDLSSVDATVASQALRRLLASHLRIQGFRNANEDALKRLELEVVACMNFSVSARERTDEHPSCHEALSLGQQ
jgi:hypothetical protein